MCPSGFHSSGSGSSSSGSSGNGSSGDISGDCVVDVVDVVAVGCAVAVVVSFCRCCI